MEGNLGLKIDWASVIVGRKFSVFAFDLTEGFLRYQFEGLIFGGAYFLNFMVSYSKCCLHLAHRRQFP